MTTNELPDRANVVAFPPLLFGSTFLVGLLLRFIFPTPLLPRFTAISIGLLLTIIGVLVLLLAFRQMIQNKTTIHPAGKTTTIVSNGLYRYTRNPMYLALTFIYAGLSIIANAFWGLLLLVPLLIVVQKGIIEREELYLTRKFGDEYLRYKAQVRRWL
jgi:protein-S-isoprenylcysteine O-methyltransferase Ste14